MIRPDSQPPSFDPILAIALSVIGLWLFGIPLINSAAKVDRIAGTTNPKEMLAGILPAQAKPKPKRDDRRDYNRKKEAQGEENSSSK